MVICHECPVSMYAFGFFRLPPLAKVVPFAACTDTADVQHGLRIAGTVEIAGLHAAPDERRAYCLMDHARALFATAIVLFVIVMGLNFLASLARSPRKKKRRRSAQVPVAEGAPVAERRSLP